MTPQPSNSNLEGPGAIVIKPDFTRQTVTLEVHFTTVHLDPQELWKVIYALMYNGHRVYGDEWAIRTFNEIGTIPVNNTTIAAPSGPESLAMGETE